MKASKLRFWMNFWPTFRAAGIRVARIADDYREVHVELRAGRLNMNYVGSHFGGSLFSMTDPFYAIMLMNILGREYVVWDKSASIEFIKPGKGTVSAKIRITDEMLADVMAHTAATGDRYHPEWPIEIHDGGGDLVARVMKKMYIRKGRDTRGRFGA